MAVISVVLLVCSGTRESQMGLCSDNRTKHDVNSSMRGSGNHTPWSKGFTIHNASTTLCINSPPMVIMAQFFGSGTIIGEKRISGLGFVKTERVARDASLVRVGVDRSDGDHESHPSCQAITNAPSVCRIKAVFMMGTDKMRQRSPEPQHHIEGSTRTPGRSNRVTSNFLVAIL